MKTHQLSNAVIAKQRSQVDLRLSGPIVSAFEDLGDSTLGQETVDLSNFGVNLDFKQNYLVVVDGKILLEGASNDYTLENVTDNEAYRIRFNSPLSAGLPIAVWKIGVKGALIPNASTINGNITTLRTQVREEIAATLVVGTASQVTDGVATHSSLSSAITAASAGDMILILKGTHTANVTIDKQLMIQGQGRGTVLSGTVDIDTGVDFCTLKDFKTTGLITVDGDGNFVKEVFTTGGTPVDNGTANSIEVIEE